MSQVPPALSLGQAPPEYGLLMRSPMLATLVYLLAGSMWLTSLGQRLGSAAWPLLLFSAVLVLALFRHALTVRADAADSEASAALDALPGVVLLGDGMGRLVGWNAAAERILGLDPQWHGRDLHRVFAACAQADILTALTAAKRGSHDFAAALQATDGTALPLRWGASATAGGSRIVLLGTRIANPEQRTEYPRDAADRLAARQRSQLERQLLIAERVLELTAEGVMVADTRGAIRWVNAAFCKISGFERAEVIGKNVGLLKSGFQEKDFYRSMRKGVRDYGHWEGEIWNRRKDGEAYLEWLTIRSVADASNTIVNYVGVFSDISHHKDAEARIKDLTYYDIVTRLPNRYLFRDRVAQAVERAQRSNRMIALVMVSPARFKQVNETLGHATGDALLRDVADRLTRAVRGQDTVARLRGDSFCCVLTDLNQGQDAIPVMNRIIEGFATSFLPNGHELFATANLGISMYPIDGTDIDDLVQKAETAMNRSKSEAENSYHFYTPEMNANLMERLRLETDLRKAISQGDFLLHYQPKVAAATGRLVGAEALVRWQHRDLGMISPTKFIPIAEDTGLILPLGTWVLEAACRQIRAWQSAGLPCVRIAVNLSALQFRQADLVGTIVGVLQRTGVAADMIELELTESAVMHNADIAVRRMLELHQAGIRLAIDDFGTGYSSLSRLKQLPLDKLKIDRSFIQDLGSSAAGEEIVGAIIAMAHGLNLAVVAEGVETHQQMEMLRRMYCDEIQGFYFSRPVPPSCFEEILRAEVLTGRDAAE